MNGFMTAIRTRRRILLLLALSAAACCLLSGQALSPDQDDQATATDQSGSPTQVIGKIWRYELFTIGQNTIKVNQIIVSLAILLGGIWLSRRLTRMAQPRLSRHLDRSVAAAIQKIAFYFLVVFVVLISLQVVNIPLTIFTFLGGALAIGLGFGAQNIINNFISGLILMIERPIRIGDLLEVEGNQGRVENVGYRCTLIKKSDGIDLLVPNSILLEKNVVNWTLSDRRFRTSVAVGAAYGSPTAEVAGLIRKAVDEHHEILKDPEPVVVFDEFGDNALNFQVYFWCEVQTFMDLQTIRSDVRFRIDELFREAGIVIAFPQRDVHLDTPTPLEVRVTGGDPHSRN